MPAELMSEVCPSVGTDPSLQPATDKHLVHSKQLTGRMVHNLMLELRVSGVGATDNVQVLI